jgi:hypothetical protein
MESTKRSKTILIGLVAMTAFCFLPEPAIVVVKQALEIMVVMQLCLEVLKTPK